MATELVNALRVRLPAHADASAKAREAIRGIDPGWIVGDAMLIASELVSYAITRADPTEPEPIELRLDLEDERVLIAVVWAADTRSAQPEFRRAGGDIYERLGLHIVGVLAERCEILAGGAWAELARPSSGRD